MKKYFIISVLIQVFATTLNSQTITEMPVRSIFLTAPNSNKLNQFTSFINDTLSAYNINTLVLGVDYNYQYKSYPQLANENALSKADIKEIVAVCKKNNIRLIPQYNFLGHQSWAEYQGNLLTNFPEFDETPSVKIPEKHQWPNKDSLMCKSYCTLHPGVHKVVFALAGELIDVFEADAFHVGLDLVLYIGHDDCKRCKGKDKAQLFADEVQRIHTFLRSKNCEMWMWGDRLINGAVTGLGEFEASLNGTHRAINAIPKDIVICDWHYKHAVPTSAYFAANGFKVVTCQWNNVEVGVEQLKNHFSFINNSPGEMKKLFSGMMITVWSPSAQFINAFNEEENETVKCFRALYKK